MGGEFDFDPVATYALVRPVKFFELPLWTNMKKVPVRFIRRSTRTHTMPSCRDRPNNLSLPHRGEPLWTPILGQSGVLSLRNLPLNCPGG